MMHLVWLRDGEIACGKSRTLAKKDGEGVIDLGTEFRPGAQMSRLMMAATFASGMVCPACEEVYRDEFGEDDEGA